MYKAFIKRFLVLVLLLLICILAFNLSIDPYNKYGINVFNIKHKLTRDDREFKISQINSMDKIDNLIIGSSRSQTLNPEILTQSLGGVSYNFGVGGGKIEDFLGLLLYLEKENKLPKNILLALDFNGFNSNNDLHDNFLNSKELNFLSRDSKQFAIEHFLSIDTIRSSIKTLKAHLKKEKPTHYFNEFGLIIGPDEMAEEIRIQELSKNYFQTQYSDGKYELDSRRINWYKNFLTMVIKYNINLKVIVTPVYDYQYKLIQKHPKMRKSYNHFIKTMNNIYSFYNIMENTNYRNNLKYFVDNVHYKQSLGDMILKDIYINKQYTIKESN